MHTEDELNRLAIDILQNGLQHPIVTTPDGQVIDGRNRLAACRLVNVEPTFTVHAGDPWTYSRSVNLHTRSMTTGQRAAACALSLIAEGKRRDGRWEWGSVVVEETTFHGSVESWKSRMNQAGFIADWSTDLDLLIAVRDGHLALDAAHKTAKARHDKALWEAEQERKKREQEIAANDAELARALDLCQALLNLNRNLMDSAVDPDNWKWVRSLAPKLIAMWTQLEEKANAKLES